jgi:hypothetical protein
MTKDYEYCEINFRLLSLGDDFSVGGFKSMWFVFIANAYGPKGRYVAAKTNDVAITNVPGSIYIPQQNELGHQSALKMILNKLTDDGWELLPEMKGGNWWSRRLRRIPKENAPKLSFKRFSIRRK